MMEKRKGYCPKCKIDTEHEVYIPEDMLDLMQPLPYLSKCSVCKVQVLFDTSDIGKYMKKINVLENR